MRALVTGGAGFIGFHLVEALVERGDEVVVVDNFRRGRPEFVHRAARLVNADIRDISALSAAASGAEVVFHLAAQSNVLGALQDVDYSFSTNVEGTFNVLKAATAAGARRVVFSSSREVYGEPVSLPVPESAALAAKNPYGASKIAGEAYCRTWPTLAPLETAIVRFGNVYGPRDRDRVIPLWFDRAANGLDLQVYGGQQILDFVPVGMAVEGLLAAAERDLDGPINVATGTGTAILDLAERIRAVSGMGVAVDLRPARGAEVVRFVGSTERMTSQLGIIPPADPLCDLGQIWEAMGRRAFALAG